MYGVGNGCFRPENLRYFSRATTNSGAQSRARLISESGKLQIALRADSAYCAARRRGGFERAVALQNCEDVRMGHAVEGASLQRPSRSCVRSSAVQRSSAWITAMVTLPSRRSLATGLPSTSSDAVRSSTSSTI